MAKKYHDGCSSLIRSEQGWPRDASVRSNGARVGAREARGSCPPTRHTPRAVWVRDASTNGNHPLSSRGQNLSKVGIDQGKQLVVSQKECGETATFLFYTFNWLSNHKTLGICPVRLRLTCGNSARRRILVDRGADTGIQQRYPRPCCRRVWAISQSAQMRGTWSCLDRAKVSGSPAAVRTGCSLHVKLVRISDSGSSTGSHAAALAVDGPTAARFSGFGRQSSLTFGVAPHPQENWKRWREAGYALGVEGQLA